MDEPSAGDADHRGAADRQRGDGGGVVLLHAEIRAGGVSADPAGGLFARDSCRTTGAGLPVLPQRGGEIVVLERARQFDVHELP